MPGGSSLRTRRRIGSPGRNQSSWNKRGSQQGPMTVAPMQIPPKCIPADTSPFTPGLPAQSRVLCPWHCADDTQCISMHPTIPGVTYRVQGSALIYWCEGTHQSGTRAGYNRPAPRRCTNRLRRRGARHAARDCLHNNAGRRHVAPVAIWSSLHGNTWRLGRCACRDTA